MTRRIWIIVLVVVVVLVVLTVLAGLALSPEGSNGAGTVQVTTTP